MTERDDRERDGTEAGWSEWIRKRNALIEEGHRLRKEMAEGTPIHVDEPLVKQPEKERGQELLEAMPPYRPSTGWMDWASGDMRRRSAAVLGGVVERAAWDSEIAARKKRWEDWEREAHGSLDGRSVDDFTKAELRLALELMNEQRTPSGVVADAVGLLEAGEVEKATALLREYAEKVKRRG